MMSIIGWVGSLFGIAGAILNAKRLRIGFVFYWIANLAMILVGVFKHEWYNVCLFSVFMAIAVYGYVSWGRGTANDRRPRRYG
jgi:nicotinamide riboside transporter PnuC